MQRKPVVMVIDDDETLLYVTREILQDEKIEVVTHQGSLGASNRITEVRPNVVLLDINMPALSGERLVDLIKPRCAEMNAAILFYSSNDEETLKLMSEAHRIQGYICKGDMTALRLQVKKHLHA